VSKLRALLGLFVFFSGIVVGVVAAQLVSPPPPPSPWRALPLVDEPASAAGVASLLIAEDARGLGRALDVDLLQRLGSAIEPLVDIDDITFTGATERQGDILSAYVAGGRSQSGQHVIVGIVFRVRDGKVVGVN
jgi:hypothetical protein